MPVTIPGINPANARILPLTGDVAEVGNPGTPGNAPASAQMPWSAVCPQAKGITGLTGGGATDLDGITTTVAAVVVLDLPFPLMIHPTVSGQRQTQVWILQTSSATPGAGVVQPADNAALRWIQSL